MAKSSQFACPKGGDLTIITIDIFAAKTSTNEHTTNQIALNTLVNSPGSPEYTD